MVLPPPEDRSPCKGFEEYSRPGANVYAIVLEEPGIFRCNQCINEMG